MPIEYVWALASAFGAAALAVTLKAVEYRHELKLSNEVIARLRKEMDVLNENHAKSISKCQEFHATEKQELLNRISELEQHLQSRHKNIQYPPSGYA